MKTLSYVAYMQPISSKRLVEVRGSGVYLHLKLLEQLAYIEHQNVGRLKIYNTTEKFQKYFGIQGDKDLLKQKLFTKVRSSNQSSPSQPLPQTENVESMTQPSQ
ncbi:Segregation and condensation protein B [Candidatus Nitrosotalea sp. TS]|nr:Segregation and condensation protein B [Candidatus Nitrosotalea sp. TS]